MFLRIKSICSVDVLGEQWFSCNRLYIVTSVKAGINIAVIIVNHGHERLQRRQTPNSVNTSMESLGRTLTTANPPSVIPFCQSLALLHQLHDIFRKPAKTSDNSGPTQLSSNPAPSSTAFRSFSLSVARSLNAGSFKRFMQVLEVGSLSVSVPARWMQKDGRSSCRWVVRCFIEQNSQGHFYRTTKFCSFIHLLTRSISPWSRREEPWDCKWRTWGGLVAGFLWILRRWTRSFGWLRGQWYIHLCESNNKESDDWDDNNDRWWWWWPSCWWHQ